MIDVYEDWEDFVDRGNDIAPPALADGFATSDKFVSMVGKGGLAAPPHIPP